MSSEVHSAPRRYRVLDAVVFGAIILAVIFFTLAYDIVVHGPERSSQQLAIEIDEALLIAAVLIIGLLVYSMRRLAEQRRELAARLAAETRAKEALELALIDPLTGVANRRHFEDTFAAASEGHLGMNALFLIDLDGFKQVNDTRGHPVGDEALKVIAARLQAAVGTSDLVSRIGGDEFAVLVLNVERAGGVDAVRRRLRDATAQPVVVGGERLSVGLSMGVALFPQDGASPSEILRRADEALYREKRERRARLAERAAG